MSAFTKEQLIEYARAYIEHDTLLKTRFGKSYKTSAYIELVRIALISLETGTPYMNQFTRKTFTLDAQPDADRESDAHEPSYAFQLPSVAPEMAEDAIKCIRSIAPHLNEGTPSSTSDRQVHELAIWVKRLAYSLKGVNKSSKLPDKAMDYLEVNGMINKENILR
ncbi:hypothetical protein [Escherichia albertii]|uniref:hypothetical protein n=1 Tax=Escherichia albertii TaxID=208962 RepID=UPI0007442874|nr:hypothetical protein [Escherichia albertii]